MIYPRLSLLLCAILLSSLTAADGMVVDKVYHPYVLPYEREFEWRLASHDTDQGNLLMQRFGYGHSISEYISLEAYIIGERDENNDFGVSAYELEARVMLTDQGEYWADWGLLFEIEKDKHHNDWEVTTGLLMEKEFGRTSLTLNAFIIYEWGQTLKNEWESEFRLKYRYRWIPQLQPAIEVYFGEDYQGLGPAMMGIQRFDGQKQLKWEFGFITEVAHHGKDNTFRLALEYEY